jgi:hypothetical protein
MRIHLIHGIHTDLSNPSVGAMVPYLEKSGIQVCAPDYGYILAAETRRINPMIVHVLKPYIETGDVLIGHSNGCAIIVDLVEELAKQRVHPAGLIFINAALDQRITIAPGVGWFRVYYNPGDTVTEIARIAAMFGTAPRTWGEMGHGGYLGDDKRLDGNIDCSQAQPLPMLNGHSDMFTPTHIAPWADEVEGFIVRKISEGAKA